MRDSDERRHRPVRRVVDLSHPIRHGMITYPGLPGPEIGVHLSREESRAHYAPGTEFAIDRITMVGNTGTYLDSPFHRYGDGADLAALPLDRTADLDGIVVRVTGAASRAIDRAVFLPHRVAGRAVLLHTGWDRHFGTPAYGDRPPLPHRGRRRLARRAGRGPRRHRLAQHRRHRRRGPPRAQHAARRGHPDRRAPARARPLPDEGFRFHAVPPAVCGMGTFPVRAYAIVPGP